MQLRDYQQEAISRIKWAMDLPGNDLLSLPTGSGKSIVIAEIANALNQDILILQPTKEILEQNKRKLSAYVDKKDIGVFSASMGEKVIKKYTFATIGSVYKVPERFAHFRLVLLDECFIAGTIVSGKKIEDIKVGDYVNSYNHKRNSIEPKKVLAVSKRWYTGELTNINNGLIISTVNHPVYIYNKGYAEAHKTTKHDKVAFYERDLYGVQERCDSGIKLKCYSTLESKEVAVQKIRKNILFKFLFGEVQKQTVFGTDEKAEHDRRNTSKDIQNIEKDRTQTTNNWWKWSWNDSTTKKIIISIGRKLVSRISSYNWEWLQTIPLQNRCSKSDIKNSNRGGWWITSLKNSKKEGYEKGRIIEIKGVESVSIYKPTDTTEFESGCWVYNLQVDDNNNYFANGVLVHNCHLLNPKSTGSMFGRFLAGMGNPKVVGLTATPYRIFPTYFVNYESRARELYQATSIKIVSRVKPRFWDRIIYNVNIQELIDKRYLCPLKYIDKTLIKQELIPLNKSCSDFDIEKYDAMVEKKDKDIVDAIRAVANTHRSVLVFCTSIAQSMRMQSYFPGSESVSSNTKPAERDRIIDSFKDGVTKIVFNVGVLTTGFDMPELDCIVLLRPTKSVALYYQMLGRGVRIAPGKTHCTVVDMSDCTTRIGTVESIKLEKVDNKWNVTTSAQPKGWHGVQLYKVKIKDLPEKQAQQPIF